MYANKAVKVFWAISATKSNMLLPLLRTVEGQFHMMETQETTLYHFMLVNNGQVKYFVC